MSDNAFRPSEEQLHAYVDGFLESPEQGAVERYLTENPGEAMRMEAYQQQNAALLALRELPLARPFTLPDFRPRVVWRVLAVRAVAAVLLLLLGGSAGWWLHGRLAPRKPLWERLVQQAERAHRTFVPEVVHPVEVTSQHEQHLQTWLSRRLGTPITVPVLRGQGYDLMGGRLLPASPGPAAQFMYQNAQGNRLTLYILASPAGRHDAAFRYEQDGALWICYWMGRTLDFALIGEVPRSHLVDIAKNVYMQLNHVKPPDVSRW